TWSSAFVDCYPAQCREPDQPLNGNFIGDTFTFPNSINYLCDPGYELFGPSSVSCQANGEWSDVAPLCERMDCGRLAAIAHGKFQLNSTLFESIAIFHCYPGYEMIGPPSIECLSDGIWSDISPDCFPVDCGMMEAPINGSVFGQGQVFQSTVRFACDTGHIMFGDSNSTCMSDGMWSSPGPDCLPVDCGTPPIVEDADFDWDGLTSTYTTVVVYECNLGFELAGVVGNTILECLDTGSWSNELPSCAPVSCGEAPNIRHANQFGGRNDEDQVFKSIVMYECEEGYYLSGRGMAKCSADKTWQFIGLPPACPPISCGTPTTIANGFYVSTGFTYRTNATYSCHDGYYPTGSLTSICQSDRRWSVHPTCHPKDCGSPPYTEHSNVNVTSTLYPAVLQYVCNEGFESQTPSTLECTDGGVWSDKHWSCDPVPCGSPPDVPHAVSMATGTTFLSEVATYSCGDGYVLDGDAKIRCTETGEISPAPECLPVVCGAPPIKHNSQVQYEKITFGHSALYPDGNEAPTHTTHCTANRTWLPTVPSNACVPVMQLVFGEIVRYECDPGYQIDGPTELSCQSNKKFSSAPPTCQPVSCGRPAALTNGMVKFTGYDFMHSATYTCDEGYILAGQQILTCQANRRWSFPPPSCNPVPCGRPPSILHGSHNLQNGSPSDFTFRKQVVYSCDDGYEFTLVSNPTLTCQSNREWDPIAPQCTPVSCGEPAAIENGNFEGFFTFGSTVQYACDRGYELEGEGLLYCQANRSWDHPAPSCTPVSCDRAPQVAHSQNHVTMYDFEEKVTYSCMEGYERDFSETSFCSSSATWAPELPICVPAPCNPPPSVANAVKILFNSIDITGTHYGDNATYFCLPGYMLSGTTTSTCEASGNWSQVCPVCSPVSCGEPDVIENGYHTAQGNYTYGEAVTFSCNRGFRLVGMSFALCNAEAQWSSSSPTCHRKSCGPAPSIPNSIFQPAELLFEDQVIYECQFGYVVKGEEFMECSEEGQWTADTTCEPRSCGPAPDVENAIPMRDTSYVYEYGDSASYTCQTGYSLVGDTNNVDCGASGAFDTPRFNCRPVECGALRPIPHATNDGSGMTFGRSISIRCVPGYHFRGADHDQITIVCQHDETWSVPPETIECLSNPCVPLQPLTFGVITEIGTSTPFIGPDNVNLLYPSSISYQCNPGYTLVGRSKRKCQTSGAWDGHAAFCQPVDCGTLPRLLHGHMEEIVSTTLGSKAHYTCETGYELHPPDSSVRTCLETGSWSGFPPFCQRISCGRHSHLENGMLSKTGVIRYGSSVHFECNVGYILEGDVQRTCGGDGRFEGIEPFCQPISCGPHPELLNAVVEPLDAQYYGDAVNITCNPGYVADGAVSSLSIQCVAGRWTDQPECASLCRHRCLHKGSCIGHNQCSCAGGWTGRRCRHPTCLLPCLNGGYCSAPYTCSCATGWTGERCQTPHCSQPCRNGGQCVAPDECRCPYGYFGANCGEESSYF
uniref:Sushi, von Willebrand factor type A, EGF and pentraxin domain containing 1 n=1 Tax=Ciona savignyi TaxID=51511 RepID=H2Z1V2_CIOSA